MAALVRNHRERSTAAAAGGRVQLLGALGSEVCFSLHDFRFGAEVLSFGMALDATLLDPQ